MKRKFISVALFGALLAASTSVTTSCKDYDDDISGLQGQITANATNLDELVNEKVNNLTQEISAGGCLGNGFGHSQNRVDGYYRRS